jgi:hypothetical protein
MMFVGDSLNRNQWESMVCLVQAEAPWDKKKLVKNGSLNVFRLEVNNSPNLYFFLTGLCLFFQLITLQYQ